MSDQRLGNDTASSADAVPSRRSVAVWIWSVLLIADAVLVTRRLSGEFLTALPGSLAVLSTVLVSAASWIAWILSGVGPLPRSPGRSQTHSPLYPRRMIPQGLSVGVTVLWVWSVSAGTAPLTNGLLLAVILLQVGAVIIPDLESIPAAPFAAIPPDAVPRLTVAGDAIASRDELSAEQSLCLVAGSPVAIAPVTTGLITTVPVAAGHSPSLMSLLVNSPGVPEFDESAVGEHDEGDSEDDSDETLTSWMSRRLTTDGELIEGWVRVHFSGGQREAVVHVAFCPPLAGPPEIETEDLDGVGLEIRVAAVFPFGGRLSVRRSGPLDDPQTDRIGFIAHSATASRAA